MNRDTKDSAARDVGARSLARIAAAVAFAAVLFLAPRVVAAQTNPGNATPGTTAPVISIVNPGHLTRVTGTFRVQLLVHTPDGSAITSVNVSTNGLDPTCTAGQMNSFAVNANYTGKVGTNAWIYERSMTVAAGTVNLKACALNNAAVPLRTFSEIVQVVAQAARIGDGNLLARDNASQLCLDCHAVQTHSSQSTSNQYGSWSINCRDCHQPHGATNVDLVRSQITPPSYRGARPTRTVVFYNKTIGDTAATAGGSVNNARTGPCQVCHTQTKNPQTSAVRWQADVANADTHYTAAAGTSACGGCHSHVNGFKASCTSCHGTPSRTSMAGADSLQPAAPPVTAPGAAVFVTGGGAHVKHVNGNGTQATLRTAPLQCSNCHLIPNTHQTPSQTDVQWTGLASTGSVVPTPAAGALSTAWPGSPSCTNYCHGQGLTGGSHKTPLWTEVAAQATFCGSCHQSDGVGHYGSVCNSCHGTGYDTTGITGTAKNTHINGSKEAPYAQCPDCHTGVADDTAIPGTRRAITPEFALAWSHKRSASPAGTVSKWDCVVCHMEGNPTTGGPDSTYHKNGVLNLRDPDTGQNIKAVYFSQSTFNDSNNGGSYSSYTTDATPAKFVRNLANASIEPDAAAIMINLCLKCHDSNGAAAFNTGGVLAPVGAVTGGTAGKPFGTTIAGTNYNGAYGFTTAACATGTNGCVVDVDKDFATTNASYHPVKGKQNNSYTPNAQMRAPWNTLAANKTGGTINTANSWGNLISCWDCHSSWTATNTQTSTVTAHGGTQTIRAGIWTSNISGVAASTGATGNSQGNLCRACHFPTTLTSQGHGSGSAASSLTSQPPGPYMPGACNFCHLSSLSKPARPLPAQDVHGFNRFAPSMGADALWPVGTLESYRPYAFFRNVGTTGNWRQTTAPTGQWRPRSGPGVPSGSATCGGQTALSLSACSGNPHSTYTPGGVY